jgi:hypothetical protein
VLRMIGGRKEPGDMALHLNGPTVFSADHGTKARK